MPPRSDPDRPPLLAMEGMEKSFPGVRALRGASLELRAGEVHALLGENGAGKSTLIRILGGILRPDAGEIRILGCPVEVRDVRGRDPSRDPPDPPGALARPEPHRRREHLPRERAGRPPLHRPAPHGARGRRTARAPALPPRSPPARRRSPDGRAPARRDRARPLAPGADPRDGRADLLPRRARSRDPLRRDPRPAARRGRDRLHLAPDRRAAADRGPGDRPARRRDRRDEGDPRDEPRGARPPDDRPRGGEYLPAARLDAGGSLPLRARDPRRAPRTARPRSARGGDPGDRGAPRLGPHGAGARHRGRGSLAAGRIALAGRRLRIRSPADGVAAGIALGPEDRAREGLIPIQTVGFNLTIPIVERFVRAARIRRTARSAFVAEAIRAYRIRARSPDDVVRRLSGGNQPKVSLAKWMGPRPRVLILDEPTRGIDIAAKGEIFDLVASLAREGTGIVFISSELREVVAWSHRIAVLRDGRAIALLEGEGATLQRVLSLCAGGEAA